ncbi:NAD-dependent epimerase/dehydratase family protein [Parvularcula maris]|uniref:NAD(P)-dependent oxidoreductase n=1 Tax=Parvularcula maris TaxID=2965077 RepID=A0A9X2L8U3_9PROT|nr:NAD(P)-dependent oxidoreductase [Parvularcula maris]
MKLLVTGSSGWLCRYLIPQLRAAGHETIGLDPAPGPLTDVEGSAADRPLVARLFEEQRFGGVIHTGALHKPDIARYPQQGFIDTNITGTLNLLEEATARPGCRFVFTSTTSLMISRAIREERGEGAVWLNETHGPLEPRNIYGVTKLAAEHLCRQHHEERGLPVIILRTSRFFPEDDDTLGQLDQENLKANEMLHRRATVEDMARAHLAALDKAEERGFGLYLVTAPPPFERGEASELKRDAEAVIARHFPDAQTLYRGRGWSLPRSIGRVYDGSLIERELGFTYETRFEDVLEALREGRPSPVANDPSYVSPLVDGDV